MGRATLAGVRACESTWEQRAAQLERAAHNVFNLDVEDIADEFLSDVPRRVPGMKLRLLPFALLLAACPGGSGVRDGGAPDTVGRDAPAAGPRPLDLLFVIDDSNTMIEEQAELIADFGALLAELDRVAGGRPSLHVGVVSSDMGVGPYLVPACTASDNGRLQVAARIPDCAPPAGSFISDDNHAATLEETFACIASLGNGGCQFEHHLASMQAALDGTNPENEGFLRDGAVLGVVILADEADCSASDPSLFNPDPAMAGLMGPLGPFTSFRCTEFGVECNGLPVGREMATYSNCKPHTTSPYIPHTRRYADLLRGLKPEGDVVVAAIAGDPQPFDVVLAPGDGHPELQPSCTSSKGTSTPAVRFENFVAELGERGLLAPICVEDFAATMTSIGGLLGQAVRP